MNGAGQHPETTDPRASRFRPGRLAVLRLGFGAMMLLLLFSAFEAWRIQERASRQANDIYRKYIRSGDITWRIRRLIYLGSISARDYFLSRAADRRATFRTQYGQMRGESQALLREIEGARVTDTQLSELRARVQEFWSAIEAAIDQPGPPSSADAYEFVQSEIVPRRTAAGALLRELNDASEQAMRMGEAESDASRRTALFRLFSVVGLCVILSLLVARLSLRYASRSELESALRYAEVAQARRDLQQLSARLLEIQEEERTRLSRELHDEIGQTLTALRIEISRARADLGTRPQAADSSLEEARLLAEKTVRTVRNISVLLRPSLLDDLGLEPALQSLIEDFGRRSGIRCTYSSEGIVEDLPDALRTCIYRVVQEALTNCARHSGATHVEIRVQQMDGELQLTVADNGKGFATGFHGAPEGKTGLGILGMRERAAALGGQLSLESAPREGTRISVRLPMPERSEKEGDA
ncbi:MAG: hypothetical protein HY822_13275 [Acidobacteria bacterium]|nr:hypothetical protein [Acidobacteriota bacterium]